MATASVHVMMMHGVPRRRAAIVVVFCPRNTLCPSAAELDLWPQLLLLCQAQLRPSPRSRLGDNCILFSLCNEEALRCVGADIWYWSSVKDGQNISYHGNAKPEPDDCHYSMRYQSVFLSRGIFGNLMILRRGAHVYALWHRTHIKETFRFR